MSGRRDSSGTARAAALSASVSRSSVLVMLAPPSWRARAAIPRAAVDLTVPGLIAEHRGDLGFRQPQPVAEHQHLAAPPGQPGQGGQHLPAVLGQQHLTLRRPLSDVRGRGVARAPEAPRDGPAAQRAAAPVEHRGPDVGERAAGAGSWSRAHSRANTSWTMSSAEARSPVISTASRTSSAWCSRNSAVTLAPEAATEEAPGPQSAGLPDLVAHT